MTAKAKNAPMSSASLIAIELKGLAAPGEALKNKLAANAAFPDYVKFSGRDQVGS